MSDDTFRSGEKNIDLRAERPYSEGQTGTHLFDKKIVKSVFSGVAGAVIQREASQHKKGHA
ncbi:hypothetical protein BV53_02535 [Candidatus Synechococcus spongiarum LMB bulk15N]|uniref:Uncharacterized protein n=1 Tax=Candidatus Synechococcus spongiarum LMB bulk15N TaxID=1943583 RepID=A0A1T1D589_9SYNE|nr:hypothetical protein BV53_02535 [Candidatus Synechococcus spongiarum LMB bulk15N]